MGTVTAPTRLDREVEDRPLVTGRRQQRDPVTGLDTFGDQSQSRRSDLTGRLGACDVGPRAVDQALEDHVVGIVAFV